MKKFSLLLLVCLAGCSLFGQDVVPLRHKPSNGSPLLIGLSVAWSFNEPFNGPTNRFSNFSATTPQVLTNVGALTGSQRTLSGGGVVITNNGTGQLVLTNASIFSLNSSFTMAFWVCGGLSGSPADSVGQLVTDANSDWNWQGQNFVTHDAGNGAHQVVGTIISASSWQLVVCGYDSANDQIFISNNGGARVNGSAGGSMRQTANMPFKICVNPAIFDNFFFWNRVLTSGNITELYNGGVPFEWPFTDKDQTHAIMNSFTFEVTNRGGTITAYETYSMSNMVSQIVAAGVWPNITCFIPMATNSLFAGLLSLAPQWRISPGNDSIWQILNAYEQRQSIVLSDITTNGLKGDGSTKFVQGLSVGSGLWGVSTLCPDQSDSGFSLYMGTAGPVPGANKVEFGYDDNTVNQYYMFWFNAYGATNLAIIGDNTKRAIATNSPNALPGYYSVQSLSASDLEMWHGDKVNGHIGIQTNLTAQSNHGWAIGSVGPAFLGQWDRGSGGVVGATLSTNAIGTFISWSPHITFAQDAAVYTAVQGWRAAIGGDK